MNLEIIPVIILSHNCSCKACILIVPTHNAQYVTQLSLLGPSNLVTIPVKDRLCLQYFSWEIY